jgi:hypothetical protein
LFKFKNIFRNKNSIFLKCLDFSIKRKQKRNIKEKDKNKKMEQNQKGKPTKGTKRQNTKGYRRNYTKRVPLAKDRPLRREKSPRLPHQRRTRVSRPRGE